MSRPHLAILAGGVAATPGSSSNPARWRSRVEEGERMGGGGEEERRVGEESWTW